MRISDWSSDVCSSDLIALLLAVNQVVHQHAIALAWLIEFRMKVTPFFRHHITQALRRRHIAVLARYLVARRRHDPFEQEAAMRCVHRIIHPGAIPCFGYARMKERYVIPRLKADRKRVV